MNCKPGDLAIVVNAFHLKENIGRVVEVLRPAIDGEKAGNGYYSGENGTGWVIRPVGGGKMLAYSHAGFSFWEEEACCCDSNLRPIRDPGDDAKDEMLRPLPHKEIA